MQPPTGICVLEGLQEIFPPLQDIIERAKKITGSVKDVLQAVADINECATEGHAARISFLQSERDVLQPEKVVIRAFIDVLRALEGTG